MTVVVPYLTFNGNCREAMTFYKSCLGGELSLQTIGDSPLSEQLPERMKDSILNAFLTKDDFKLLASDMVGEMDLIKGNSISLFLKCKSEHELRNFFVKLSEGGKATHQLEKNHWGKYSGELTDKYGTQWMLYYHPEGN